MFAPRGKRCIFIGYPQGQKGWRLYDPDLHKFFTSRDVVFYEHIFPCKESARTQSIIEQQEDNKIFLDIEIAIEDNQHVEAVIHGMIKVRGSKATMMI